MAKYLANDKYSAVLSAGYTVGQTTLSVSAVPDNVPTIVVLAKGTDNETVFTVTGKTINSLTGVARIRGANTNLDTTTPVTILNNQEFINQYQDVADTPEAIAALVYAADGGSTDAYAISLDTAPEAYVEGMVVAFKANTANTGPATLDVNTLGAVAIKKNVTDDLASGDIQADQIVVVVHDGTNFQIISDVPEAVDDDETWTDATDAGTITFDLEDGAKGARKQRVTLGGNRTLALSNVKAGQPFILRLKQDGTGNRTVTWFAGITWITSGGTAPTLQTAADKVDTLGFIQTGTNTYDGYVVGSGG